ncbi:IS30 family transposase [Tenuifilum thalassicum]|uniref:IS30 family transposase n=1 Tax=Tenuifilum thalassicum TaxID=2590900 RepID=A0A7D4AVV6_9BACT|nr:IS30 family transposase [Tenuifilum thalassicum]QKG78894.1 IS30 family transposase [Tenuifilum thalassicum]
MKHLTLEQRYAIKAYLDCGKTKSEIARALKVHKSTIYREISRNSSKRGAYNPDSANELAEERKERFCQNRRFDTSMQVKIDNWIKEEQWSPEQIKGHCDRNGIEMVSHERIYQYIRADKQAGGELHKHMRHKLKHRNRPVGGKRVVIKNKVSIDDRPAVINNKERFGDWEIDLIVGRNNKGAMVTLVERKTSMILIRKLEDGKDADGLANTVIRMLLPYKNSVKSITSDNGSEFARHEKIAKKLQADFYFAHPYSSWERGLSEYSNKLIRQYIPKKSNFDTFDSDFVKQVQHKINRRPRKTLHFSTPKTEFFNCVAFAC